MKMRGTRDRILFVVAPFLLLSCLAVVVASEAYERSVDLGCTVTLEASYVLNAVRSASCDITVGHDSVLQLSAVRSADLPITIGHDSVLQLSAVRTADLPITSSGDVSYVLEAVRGAEVTVTCTESADRVADYGREVTLPMSVTAMGTAKYNAIRSAGLQIGFDPHAAYVHHTIAGTVTDLFVPVVGMVVMMSAFAIVMRLFKKSSKGILEV